MIFMDIYYKIFLGDSNMKKCVVIYNPNSGKIPREKILPKFEKILKEYGYESEMYLTERRLHTTEIVESLSDDISLVISVGGDGTFNESMTGNFKREKRLVLAHIPVGTTNDIGTMFGYGKDMINNLKLTLEGKIQKIDICLINDKPFIYSAGFGKFMNIPYETPRELKKKIGPLAYLTEGAKSLASKTKLYDITYEIDGIESRGLFSFFLITSANRVAGINNFYKDIKLDDDKFEVLMCNMTNKVDILKSLYYLTMYDATRVPGLYFHKTNNLKVKFNNPLDKAWCIDGEELTPIKNKYEIKIQNGVEILMPTKNVKKLFIKK